MEQRSNTTGDERTLLVAFEGWSDAGSASTTALRHLASLLHASVQYAISADGYADFQLHRPRLVIDEQGERALDWPESRLYGVLPHSHKDTEPSTNAIRHLDGTAASNVFLFLGIEPARNWSAFADEVLEMVEEWDINQVIFVSSLFSGAPHSRPVITSLTSSDPGMQRRTGARASDYEGPIGISTLLEFELADAGIPALALWAEVPHYVHSLPSPKATLAILDQLEELLDLVIPRGELLNMATEWEENLNRLTEADEDLGDYVRSLEAHRDATSAPEATGEAIAKEFERFLDSAPAAHDPELNTRERIENDHSEHHSQTDDDGHP